MEGDDEYAEEFEDVEVRRIAGSSTAQRRHLFAVPLHEDLLSQTPIRAHGHGQEDEGEEEEQDPGERAGQAGTSDQESAEDLGIAEDDQDGDASGDKQEDPLEAKIAVEHERFRQAQAVWQEKVRAFRPWSAPPLCSPSVQEQRQRSEEAAGLREAAANDPRSLAATPRAEYVPPERPYLAATAARGGPPLAHLAPPRPISADSGRTMYRSSTASGGLTTEGSFVLP